MVKFVDSVNNIFPAILYYLYLLTIFVMQIICFFLSHSFFKTLTMKKNLLIAALAMFFSCQGLLANQADDFKYNKQQVQDEFADLNRLEQTVVDNSFMTLSEMQQNNMIATQFSNLNLAGSMMGDPALGIPGFWWGCVFGPVGILAVYVITDNDRSEVKKALTGCLVSTGFWVAINIILYAVGASFYGI